MVLKVKEPIAEVYDRMREGLTLFTYLHLAADKPLTKELGDTRLSPWFRGATSFVVRPRRITCGSQEGANRQAGGSSSLRGSESKTGHVWCCRHAAHGTGSRPSSIWATISSVIQRRRSRSSGEEASVNNFMSSQSRSAALTAA
jgi:hypothetical protein